MATCRKCDLTFDRGKTEKSKTTCNSCDNKFHPKCVNMSVAICDFINSSVNTTWLCDDCAKSDDLKCILNKLSVLEAKIELNSTRLINLEQKTPVLTKNNAAAMNINSPTPKRRLADIVSSYANNSDNNVPNSAKRVKVTASKSTVREKNDPITQINK